MNYLPMNQLGALEISPNVIQFGIFLPGVDSGQGYAVSVKIIHETDQYLQAARQRWWHRLTLSILPTAITGLARSI
jgi:hypothetical protein